MHTPTTGMYGRINDDGTVSVLRTVDSTPVTTIDADGDAHDKKPLRFEHLSGVIVSKADADKLGLEFLDAKSGGVFKPAAASQAAAAAVANKAAFPEASPTGSKPMEPTPRGNPPDPNIGRHVPADPGRKPDKFR